MSRSIFPRIRPVVIAAIPFLALIVLLCSIGQNARADLIILKDGTVLYGKARRESERFVDSQSNELVTVPKGFFYVDNGPRRLYFSLAQMAEVTDQELPPGRIISSPRKIFFPRLRKLRGIGAQTLISNWDDKWDRVIRLETEMGKLPLRQHLSVLTPYLVKADCTTKYKWNAFYLTEELGREEVRSLLDKHPLLKITSDLKPEDQYKRRVARHQFFYQAGWYDDAQFELNTVYKDFPDKKEPLKEQQKELLRLWGREYLKDIHLAQFAGRHQWVQRTATNPEDRFADDVAIREELQLIKLEYEEKNKKLEQAKRLLVQLGSWVKDNKQKQVFDEAIPWVMSQIGYENLNRLETFLLHAEDMVDESDDEMLKASKAEKFLSMAVTGWLMGASLAESNFETAKKVWEARLFLIRYLSANGRARELRAYEAQGGAVSVDVMSQILKLMPPVEAVKEIPKEWVLRKARGVNYWLQLPEEYHHRRAYPVLIVLHDSGSDAKDMLERWSPLARKHGYILIAPQWQNGFAQGYNYTAAEHMKVLDSLMDLRRHFHIADDRVFLFGMGEAGNMAYDVGLSHPDYFAGVMPMSATIHLVTRRYWPNAQYLPFYVVGGDHAGEPNVQTRKQFERWVPHGYPSIFAQYKGRGREWFSGELPFMFEWMKHKKRRMPLGRLGKMGAGRLGDEFQTHRPTDNSFYWLTSSNIAQRHWNGGRWNPSILPARIHARIQSEFNHVYIYQRGFKQLTIWFTRDGQVDFDQPVKVNVGIKQIWTGKVQPNLSALLEHFSERRDRGRLFVARIQLGK